MNYFLCRIMAAASLVGLTGSLSIGGIAAAETQDKAPMFTEAGHTTDELSVVKERVLAKEAVLLDVREMDEWNAGHLKVASLMPLSELRDGAVPEKYVALLPKDKPIYLHCRSGGRVLMCAEALQGKGYDIRPLKAGYEKLLQSGFEKAQDSADSTPK